MSFMLSGTKVRLGSSFLTAVVHGECFQPSNHDIVMHKKKLEYYLITHKLTTSVNKFTAVRHLFIAYSSAVKHW